MLAWRVSASSWRLQASCSVLDHGGGSAGNGSALPPVRQVAASLVLAMGGHLEVARVDAHAVAALVTTRWTATVCPSSHMRA